MLNINTNLSNSTPNNISNTNRPNNFNPKTTTDSKNITSSPSAYSGSPDTIEISEAGKTQALQAQESVKTGTIVQVSDEALLQMYQEQIDSIAESESSSKDGASEVAKILKIARRIADGDIVPKYDEQKVMEYNMVLYQVAKAAAMLNAHKEHKIHKSLYDDEEQNIIDMQQMLELAQTGENSGADTSAISEEGSIAETGL